MRLGSNYGGIIQAYSLQSFISKIGFSTYTMTPTKTATRRKESSDKMKRLILKIMLNKDLGFIPTEKDLRIITQKNSAFVLNHIKTTKITSNTILARNRFNNYHTVVIGSDQVWRAHYVDVNKYLAENMPNCVNRISYAASFGIDNSSEYSDELMKSTKKLAKKFKAISVREDSGIKLCKKMWGIDAEQHIDPTLLIDKDEYIQLINADMNTLTQNNGIFAYILDRSNDKNIIIKKVEKTLNLKSFEIMPPVCNSKKEFKSNPDKFVLPPVTQWLKSFNDAEFIVTDSFHGCVFSIIFNKPFIAIGNNGRGLTRFTSLLKLFGLENRLVLNSNDLTEKLIKDKINWSKIQEIIEFEQRRSLDFLTKNLTNEAKNE